MPGHLRSYREPAVNVGVSWADPCGTCAGAGDWTGLVWTGQFSLPFWLLEEQTFLEGGEGGGTLRFLNRCPKPHPVHLPESASHQKTASGSTPGQGVRKGIRPLLESNWVCSWLIICPPKDGQSSGGPISGLEKTPLWGMTRTRVTRDKKWPCVGRASLAALLADPPARLR